MISNAVSSTILFVGLLRTEGVLRVHIGKLRLDRGSFRWVMKIGLPAGAQSAVFSISNLVIQAAINTLGTNVMAGSSAAFNLEVIAYYVFNAFTQACTTFVGQNYGAGQLDRCKKTLRCAYVEDALATGAAELVRSVAEGLRGGFPGGEKFLHEEMVWVEGFQTDAGVDEVAFGGIDKEELALHRAA